MATQSPLIKDFHRDVTAFGSLVFSLILVLVPVSFNEYRLATQLSVAFILSYAITFPIKFLFFKERPEKQPHSNLWERVDASSFPSLHSMRATSYAIPLIAFNPAPLFTAIVILLALGTMITRLTTRKHFMVDIIAGALIGLILGTVITFTPVADTLLSFV